VVGPVMGVVADHKGKESGIRIQESA
jgi:hypothetical protein